MELTVQDETTGQETGPYNEQDLQILEGKEQDQAGQEPQEELIGGKFKTADDLLQAYKELETKLGQRGNDTDTQDEEATPEAQEEKVEVASLGEEQEQTIIESIGGQNNFTNVQDWAEKSLDQEELNAYNREVNSGDYFRARNALQSMYFAYTENAGKEPNLIGGKTTAATTDIYRSVQEVEAAMNDPRYLNDTAYTRDVEEKIGRSDVLTPR